MNPVDEILVERIDFYYQQMIFKLKTTVIKNWKQKVKFEERNIKGIQISNGGGVYYQSVDVGLSRDAWKNAKR